MTMKLYTRNETIEYVIRLIPSNKKIDRIKAVRKLTGCRLVEAKDWCDELQKKDDLTDYEVPYNKNTDFDDTYYDNEDTDNEEPYYGRTRWLDSVCDHSKVLSRALNGG